MTDTTRYSLLPSYDDAVVDINSDVREHTETHEQHPYTSGNAFNTPTDLADLADLPGYNSAEYNTLSEAITVSPPQKKTEKILYSSVDACHHAAYLLRTDGIIDRTSRCGVIQMQLIAPAPHRYIGVSAGDCASYLLRSDGCIIRTAYCGVVDGIKSERRPPPGARYVGVSAGAIASYFIRDDGVVDRATTGGYVTSELRSTDPDVRYIGASAAKYHVYLLRSDGAVDKRSSDGSIMIEELRPHEGKAHIRYIGLADQLDSTKCKSKSRAVMYLVRSDGAVDLISAKGLVTTMLPPDGLKYIAAACGSQIGYLTRSDGAVVRITGCLRGAKFDVSQTMVPSAKGARYISVSCGSQNTYLMRTDGIVDRTTACRPLRIGKEMRPPTSEEVRKIESCAVM